MSSIDRRVVEAQFNNKDFEKGVDGTLSSLDKLKKGLRLDGATKGLSDVDSAAKKVSLQPIATSIDRLTSKFSLMRITGVAAFIAIASKGAAAATDLLKSFTIQPITDGLAEYETNMNSIQTILSNTQWENKELEDVNAALQELNTYSDQTIYNFSEMARNIGTFTAAGVELDTSVGAIKGIANLAAVSGSSSVQASTAMYQLSQAISSGTVRLMDWNSVQNAGLGGKVFQDSLMETARVHGVAIDDIIEETGSFRESLAEGWLNTDILTETLSKFTGDLTKSQLEQMGYTEEQIEGVLEMGETAVNAATKIKTVTQLIGALQEAAGSGWAQTWQLVIGDFDQAKELFTEVNDVIGGFIGRSAEARNKVIGDWARLGGRTALIDAIKNAFTALLEVIKPIRDAFRLIFPPKTGEQLVKITETIRDFFARIKIGVETANQIRRVFMGVFAVFGIVFEVAKAFGGFLIDVFKRVTEGGGELLERIGDIGYWLYTLYDNVKNGTALTDFFDSLSDKVVDAIEWIRQAADRIRELLGQDFQPMIIWTQAVERLSGVGDIIGTAWAFVKDVLSSINDLLEPIKNKVKDFFSKIPGAIQNLFENMDYSAILSTINTGLFGALVLMINRWLNGAGESETIEGFKDLIGSLTAPLGSINDVFQEMTATLDTMQNTLRATTILQIAAAVGIMAYAATQLAKLDAEDVGKALGAMAVALVELFASLALVQLIGGVKGMTRTAFGLTVISVALLIMAKAVESLADMTWEELSRGLSAVGSLLVGMAIATQLMSTNTGGMIRASIALTLMAVAVRLLAESVEYFGGMDWETMKQGLIGVGALLAGLSLFTRLATVNGAGISQGLGLILLAGAIRLLAYSAEAYAAMDIEALKQGLGAIGAILAGLGAFTRLVDPKRLGVVGVSMVLISGAMYILAKATEQFANMDIDDLRRGLAGMGAALAGIVLALNLMPATSLLSAGALAIIAVSLGLLTKALQGMGSMSWEEIGKGLATLGGALVILAVGLNFLSGAFLGAATLGLATVALASFVPILYLMGDLSWETIGKGLATLAGLFLIIGAAGYLLTPTIPTFLGLAYAFAIFGAGIGLVGLGILGIGEGLKAIASAGEGAAGALTVILDEISLFIPQLAQRLAEGFIIFMTALADGSESLFDAVTRIVKSILKVIKDLIPDVIDVVVVLISRLLDALGKLIPKAARTMLRVMLGILNAINSYIPRIVNKVADMLVRLLRAITRKIPSIATAATDMIVAFLNAIQDNIGRVITAGADLIIDFIDGIGSNALRVTNAALDTLVTFLDGLARAIRNNSYRIRSAGKDIALAIIDGLTGGLGSKVGEVASKAREVASNALNSAKEFLGISSPSKAFMEIGNEIGNGLVVGMDSMASKVGTSAKKTGETALDAMRKSLSGASDLINNDLDLNPKITPVIDMTEIRKGVSKIGNSLDGQRLAVGQSYSSAQSAAATSVQDSSIDNRATGFDPISMTYIQNNTSPKALSAAEIYRQTNNQLSTVKGALT